MRSAILGLALFAVSLSVVPCRGQTAGNPVDPFTGRIVFHQKEGRIAYEVTITDGQVRGRQLLGSTPIATIVGGWFDYKKGRLSLLVQGIGETVPQEWRSQCQQFKIDLQAKEVTLEHMLYAYGATLNHPQPLATVHLLDSLDASVRLIE